MKLTATATFLSLAAGTGKELNWRFYFRKISVLSTALNTGTWTEITDRVDMNAFRQITSNIEISVGQFTNDAIKMTVWGIQWLKANMQNPAAGEYVEVKIEFTITGASDIIYEFAGYVDMRSIQNTEVIDQSTFRVISAEELGDRMGAESISTQYIEPDLINDGSNVQAIVLQNIPGLFVRDANLASYQLKKGIHSITYDYNGGSRRAKLDNGPWRILTTGDNILGDTDGGYIDSISLTSGGSGYTGGAPAVSFTGGGGGSGATGNAYVVSNVVTSLQLTAAGNNFTSAPSVVFTGGGGSSAAATAVIASADNGRVKVYVPDLTKLPSSGSMTDYCVVVANAITLPNNLYQNTTIKPVLTKAFSLFGITSVTFDQLDYPTFDGNPRAQVLDIPPMNGYWSASTYAITNDGTDIYIPIGNRIYKRSMANDSYSLLAKLSDTTSSVMKMFYNARNNHLWIYFYRNSNGFAYVAIVNATTGSVVGSETRIDLSGSIPWHYGMELMDFNYTGSSYHYALIFTSNNTVREINSSMTITQLFTTAALNVNNITGDFAYMPGVDTFRVKCLDVTTNKRIYVGVYVSTSNVWTVAGKMLTTNGVDDYNVACYSSGDARIYYRTINVSPDAVKSHHVSVDGLVYSHLTLAVNDFVDSMTFGGGSAWFTVAFFGSVKSSIYSVTGTAAASKVADGVYFQRFGMMYFNSRIYGVTLDKNGSITSGKLMQVYNRVTITLATTTNFAGLSIRTAINNLLAGFNLVGNVSMNKSGKVYRRCDDTGNLITTGNVVSITVNEASDIVETISYSPKADLIRITNLTTSISTDGTSFGIDVLTDAILIDVSNPYVDSSFLKDLAKWIYQFFKQDRNLYRPPCAIIPLFQYELIDGGSITFTTTNIQKTASGPIYRMTHGIDGTMIPEILV